MFIIKFDFNFPWKSTFLNYIRKLNFDFNIAQIHWFIPSHLLNQVRQIWYGFSSLETTNSQTTNASCMWYLIWIYVFLSSCRDLMLVGWYVGYGNHMSIADRFNFDTSHIDMKFDEIWFNLMLLGRFCDENLLQAGLVTAGEYVAVYSWIVVVVKWW